MSTMDVSRAAQFCVEARRVLGRAKKVKGTSSHKMDGRIKACTRLLEQVRGAGFAIVYEQKARTMASIGSQARVARTKAEAKAVSERLAGLQRELELFTATMSDVQVKRAACEQEIGAAEAGRQRLAAHPYAADDGTPTIEAMIADARARLATGDVDGATTAIAPHARSYAAAWARGEAAKAGAIRQAKAKPHYETKMLKLRETLEELKDLPGAEPQCDALRRAIAAGEAKVPNPEGVNDYHGGYEAIVAIAPKTSTVRKKAVKAGRRRESELASDTTLGPAVASARTALAALADLVSAEELAEHDVAILVATKSAVDASGAITDSSRASAVADLAKVERDLGQLRTQRAALKARCDAALATIDPGLRQLETVVKREEKALATRLLAEARGWRAMVNGKRFDDAADGLEALAEAVTTAVDECDGTRDAFQAKWAAASDERDRIRDQCARLDTLFADDSAQQGLGAVFLRQLGKYEADAASGLVREALARIGDVAEEVDRLVTVGEARATWAPVRDRLAQEVAALATRAAASIDAVRQTLGEAGHGGLEALAMMEARLAAEREAWETRLKQAANERDLDAPGTTARLEAMIADWAPSAVAATLEQRVEEGSAHAAERREKEQLGMFRRQVEEVQAALGELLERDAGRHANHLKMLGVLEGRAPDPTYEASIEQAAARLALVRADIESFDTDWAAAKAITDTRFAEAQAALAALQKVAGSIDRRSAEFFAPCFDALDGDLHELDTLRVSRSMQAQTVAQAGLAEFGARVRALQVDIQTPVTAMDDMISTALADAPAAPDDAEAAAEDDDEVDLAAFFALFEPEPDPADGGPADDAEPAPTPVVASFRLVQALIARLEEDLATEALATCLPNRHAMLGNSFKEAKAEAQRLVPEAAIAVLKAWHATLQPALTAAETASSLRQTFMDTLKPAAKDAIKRLDATAASQYVADLTARRKAAETQLVSEGGEQKAVDAINAVINEATLAFAQPELLQTREVEAEKAAAELEVNRAGWKKEYADFTRNTLGRVKAALKAAEEPEWSQLDDVAKLGEQADEQALDTHNFVGARHLLDNARQMAARVIAAPEGFKATSRNNLPRSNARWKKSVRQFNASIDEVVAAIDAAGSGETDPDVAKAADAARRSLIGLKRLFDPGAFDDHVTVLADHKGHGVRDRRAVREVALRDVRRYEGLLTEDPILIRVMKTPRPFGLVNESVVYAALQDLNLNIQRCI